VEASDPVESKVLTNEPEAVETLKKLLADGHLRLSSDDRLAQHFHALVRIGFPSPDGTKKHGTTYLIHRDAERVAVLVLSDTALPYCYMTNGLAATFDPTQRGRVLAREQGNPTFVLSSDPAGTRFVCDVSYDTRAESASVVLDFSSLLAAPLANAKGVRLDRQAHSIEVSTEHAILSVELPEGDDRHGFPIKALAISGQGGDSLAAGPIGTESAPAAHILGITKEQIERAGLKVKTAGAEEAARFEAIVPADFGKDRNEKQAAQRLMGMFFN
jgi:hypothetical protein